MACEVINRGGWPSSAILLVVLIASVNSSLRQGQEQLNCTESPGMCPVVCNEPVPGLPYSGTFCDSTSGSCVCDCRTELKSSCEEVPFTECFQDCVRKNPNPDVYLYKGGNCPVVSPAGRKAFQCACECSIRDDYVETNDI